MDKFFIKEANIPSFRSIIQLQANNYLHELRVKEHPSLNHRRLSDPIKSKIYVHYLDQSHELPNINFKSRRSKTIMDKKNQSIQKKTVPFKINKYETLPSDLQCERKFVYSLSQRVKPQKQIKLGTKKFLEIDILTLQTCYAKNITLEARDHKKQNQMVFKQLLAIPSKQKISEFIKMYRMSNQSMSVDQLVRSKYFAVKLNGTDSFYFGDIKQGEMDGKGVMITKNWIFEGQWSKSQKIEGIQITCKGTYKGKFFNNERSKVGQFYWNNGQYYSGEWQKNKKHGTGIWKSKRGDIYMGQWSKGKVEGYGIHLNKNGQKYQGFFQNFLKHGRGKQFFPNGDQFQGNFKQGKPQGPGIYKWKSGLVYEGEFEQGFRSGKGKIMKNDIQYQGFFEKQKAHGQGKLTVWNRYHFVGNFKKGKKQGKGVQKQSKKVFVGVWRNNRFMQQIQ